MYYTSEYYRQLRDRVAQLIDASGSSERELSISMGCDPSYLNKIVNGKGNFSLPKLLCFFDTMKITPEEFFPTPLNEENAEMKTSDREDVGLMFDAFKRMSPNAQTALLDILISYSKLNQ